MMNKDKQQGQHIDLNKLVNRLKTEDVKYGRISRTLQIIYWVFIPVYVFLTINDYLDSGEIRDLIGGGFFILAFLIFALFFGKYYKEYNFVDYSLPTIQLLKKAVWRYKPFQLKSLWAVLAVVFMDFGLIFGRDAGESIIRIQLIYWGVIAISIGIGMVIWYYKYKPLHDQALALLRDIQGE